MISMFPTIRPATFKDVDILVHFNERLAREIDGKELDSDVVRAAIEAQLCDPSLGRYLVACDGDEVVGQCRVWFEYYDWAAKPAWWLDDVFVARRRSGVLRALFEHVHRLAEAAGVVKLRLHVSKTNAVARQAYQRLGFQSPSDMMELDIEASPLLVPAIENIASREIALA